MSLTEISEEMPLNGDNPQPETTKNNARLSSGTRTHKPSFTERGTNTSDFNESDPFLQHLAALIQEINDTDTRRTIETEIIKYVKGMKQKSSGLFLNANNYC